MEPERHGPDDPRAWLERAQGNLRRAVADVRLQGIYLEDLCFDAQQAAEKAIKAALLHARVDFPYVHDLTALLTLFEEHAGPVPAEIREAGRLTRFAGAARYPGVGEPVTQGEYERAISIAEQVVSWAEDRLQPSSREVEP